MYKYKFIAAFIIFIAVQTAIVVFMFQDRVIPTTVDDTDIVLQRSASLIEKSHRIDEFALMEKARFVAARSELREAVVDDYEGDWRVERHREVHRQLNVERIRFEQMADRNVDERNLDLSLMDRRPLDHDFFMALDESGRLISARGSSSVQQRMDDDFASRFSVVLEAMEEDKTMVDMWNWSWRAADDREFFVVAVSPIRHPDTDEPVGTVVLGNRVTDGVAERRQSLIADGLGGEGIGQRTQREHVQTPDLTFFRGDRIYSTTLSARETPDLTEALFERHDILDPDKEDPQRVLDLRLGESNYRAMIRFFPGQLETDNPAGVVLVINSDDTIAPHTRARSHILAITGVILLFGVALFFFLFQAFVAPFARIEDGIQTIISGDKDYEFDTEDGHETSENLARHLNLMSAFLQGKPMPDDDVQSLGGWDAFDTDDPTESQGPTNIAGVDMMALGNKKSDDDGDAGDEDSTPEATTEETT